MALNDQVRFTWVGHGTWKIRTAGGKDLLIDPWLAGNPAAPEHLKKVDSLDLMVVTHGHGDHIADAVEIAKAIELLGVRTVVPMHFGTFPALHGTPAQLQELVGPGVTVLDIKPGDEV